MMEQAHQQHPELTTRCLCELFGVSPSWYYERASQPAHTEEDIALRDEIERIILECPGYGYRRVTHTLHRQGQPVNHKRVLRIMREESLLYHLKKRFVVHTTDSRHGLPVYPNRLAGVELTAPSQAWVADITYIRLCRLCVPGVHPGCLLAALRGLASLARYDHAVDAGGLAARYRLAPAAAGSDPPF